MRANNFKYLIKEGISNTWHNRIMSFASFCILMVGLLIIGLAALILKDINIIVGNVENENMAIIYLEQDVTEEQVSQVEQTLKSNQNLTNIVHVTRDEALQIMIDKMSYTAENVKEIFSGLDGKDFLPDSFKMQIVDLNGLDEVQTFLNELQEVESVYVPTDFANKLKSVERIVGVVGIAVLAALIVVCVIIISNTARASVFARKKEINIMKYVGATNSFVRMPFFIEGVFIGLIAALAAWGLTWFGYESLYKIIVESGDLASVGVYDLLHFGTVKWWVLGAYSVVSVFISSLGNIVCLRKYVKV